MRQIFLPALGILAGTSLALSSLAHADTAGDHEQLEHIVNTVVEPLMKQNAVPGMAVAITTQGKQYVFNYGLASKEGAKEVTDDTIFEIGSISKTFTATLASYAQEQGKLSLTDSAGEYFPAFAGSSFDKISLLELGTYTAGGMPLQFPDEVSNQEGMIAYYKGWRPAYAAGTYRQYSNPSIGLLGFLAARSMGEPFDELMEKRIFPALGLASTYIRVPQARAGDYAYGYSKDDKPIRVTPGILDAQAYGVKTNALDLIRFVESNMNDSGLDETLRRALTATRAGYYKVGGMIQGLGWEIYAYPTDLDELLLGNSSQISLQAHQVSPLASPAQQPSNVLINKTGSTNGFGAYVAFVPAKSIGVVLLANKNYPISERIKAAHRILMALDTDLTGIR